MNVLPPLLNRGGERSYVEYQFTILGRLNGLNEYTTACRANPHAGAKMKRDAEETVIWEIRQQVRGLHIEQPVRLEYEFYERNKRRDLDNISSFAHKVIQDSLVKSHVIRNDGWNEIIGFIDHFFCDNKNPRIVVTIKECEKDEY